MNLPALDEIYALLLHIDAERAERARNDGCPTCGARVHSARYPRKPRGVPRESSDGLDMHRFSFCCSQEGCRKRVTPPSVRFLDRRVYLGMVVVFVTAVRQGPTPPGLQRIRNFCGADRKTVMRWREWWQDSFPDSRMWQLIQGRLSPTVQHRQIPRGLLESFRVACPIQRLLLFLKFLASSAAELSKLFEGDGKPAEYDRHSERRLNWGHV